MKRNYSWLALLLASPAAAHVGLSHVTGFMAGVAHPLSGLDHICAMVAVGLWAKQQGGKAQYILPLAFVAAMLFGSFLPMPGIEQGIAASVLVLGLLVACAVRLPVEASAGLVGLFALFHGAAHGLEGHGSQFGVGFTLSTIALHAVGLSIGSVVEQRTARYAGAACAFAGLYLII
jgi:urease accessory protein